MDPLISVLLIEDDRVTARLTSRMVEKVGDGFQVDWAADLTSGLESLSSGTYDLVLLDLTLPDSTGIDTFHTVHAHSPGVPVIVLTGNEEGELANETVRSGAQDYLVKGSFDAELLRRTLNYALERHRALEERRTIERQLNQAQKLESIGQLAAGIAHEINTPTQFLNDNTRFVKDSFEKLAPLLGECRRLVEAAAEGPPDEAFLERILAAAEDAGLDFIEEEVPNALEESLSGLQHVGQIVRAMKTFSYPDSGEMQHVDINECIRSTATVACNEWKNVAELTLDLDDSLPLIPCMPGKVNQVLLNMIVNASHAIEDGRQEGDYSKGSIRISTKFAGDFVQITIQDSGAGMDEKVQQRIFDPFFTTKEVGRGTGQGLAISHNLIVEQHAGRIDVRSEVGAGTTFEIHLPTERPGRQGNAA